VAFCGTACYTVARLVTHRYINAPAAHPQPDGMSICSTRGHVPGHKKSRAGKRSGESVGCDFVGSHLIVTRVTAVTTVTCVAFVTNEGQYVKQENKRCARPSQNPFIGAGEAAIYRGLRERNATTTRSNYMDHGALLPTEAKYCEHANRRKGETAWRMN
jgi:hypothetical protein